MTAIYNEIEPYACDWLQNLITAGHIANGRVERRSIKDLSPAGVAGGGQRHFFAGIGVWSYALRLAGVPDDLSVWTGSCPCQPFSSAGRGAGVDDERHLWPDWFKLIRECRPAVVFGEQVASPDGLGWLDAVCADMEGAGYSVGAADLCAAGVGAPHRRQRLYFVAYADAAGLREQWRGRLLDGERATLRHNADGCGENDRVADAHGGERDGRRSPRTSRRRESSDGGDVGHADPTRPQGHGRPVGVVDSQRRESSERHGATAGVWGNADWIDCLDGKARPVEPGTFPLAHGTAGRVGRLRAYGNAIVPQVAATFIRAALERRVIDHRDIASLLVFAAFACATWLAHLASKIEACPGCSRCHAATRRA